MLGECEGVGMMGVRMRDTVTNCSVNIAPSVWVPRISRRGCLSLPNVSFVPRTSTGF